MSIQAQETDAKLFTVQLDSSTSKVTYHPDFIFCETLFDSSKKVQIHYSLYKKSLKKFYVIDSCKLGELAEYDYEIRPNKKVYGSMSHSIIPCVAYTSEDMKEITSEKYHYKSEDIQKFCLDLFDRIEITKKTIFLD
ncbi:hypothetical protein [uncultured Dokdonia sp.]|uniref:hypothetical protein n=1 Tax=uncultured Dokdonia sp. TaxID=575653 RepID=UPI002604403F|nr:hypothetical protein [uncultured Dokdonia sp.]